MIVLLYILCFFIPPLAVLLTGRGIGLALLNLLLCVFFWIPGVIHALYVVRQHQKDD